MYGSISRCGAPYQNSLRCCRKHSCPTLGQNNKFVKYRVFRNKVASPDDVIVEKENLQTSINGNTSTVTTHDNQQHIQMQAQTPVTSFNECSNLSDVFSYMSFNHSNLSAIQDPHHKTGQQNFTFKELDQNIEICALALKSLGLQKGDVVSLFSENSNRWLLLDAAIMRNGAIDAVRGVSSSADELAYIFEHSGSVGLVVQDDATLKKVLPVISTQNLKFIVVLYTQIPENLSTEINCPVLQFEDLINLGQQIQNDRNQQNFWPVLAEDDAATIVYTSGTSGHPKGVLLSHGNILYQMRTLDQIVTVNQKDQALSLLPPWHIYERTTTYYILMRGCQVTYTAVPHLKNDLVKYKPFYMCAVPLVMDTLHKRVMQALRKKLPEKAIDLIFGIGEKYIKSKRVLNGMDVEFAINSPSMLTLITARIQQIIFGGLYVLIHKVIYSKIRTDLGIQSAIVSGGSSLPEHIDLFYQIIGLPVLHGWGLTETSPVLSCRPMRYNGDPACTIGFPLPQTQIKVVDRENLKQQLPDGEEGVMLAKGPGVMQGYYNQADLGIQPDGWYNTGDLGWIIPEKSHHKMGGAIVITGRAKDVIVLSSGENVSPQIIEDTVQSSPFIKSCVLLGQDHRSLGAFICMDEEILGEQFPEGCDVRGLAEGEIKRLVNLNPKFARWEHIAHFVVLPKQLSFEDGTLTRTMKPKREAILKMFRNEADEVLAKLR